MSYDLALQKLEQSISSYLEIKQTIIKDEYLGLVEDLSVGFRAIRGLSRMVVMKRFELFLKGLDFEEQVFEKHLQKLHHYISDERKATFIADTITKVQLSQSNVACTIMGVLLGPIVNKKVPIDHNTLICMQALQQFFDVDIVNFNFLSDFINEGSQRGRIVDAPEISQAAEASRLSVDSVMMTKNKAISNQLLFTKVSGGGGFNVGASEICRISTAGRRMAELIKRCDMLVVVEE